MSNAKQKSDRRMGPAGSENWHMILDGAEEILRDEGHAALSSRRVAECIGVKQRLIYYYFQTMDDLVVALFHRRSERELERLNRAALSDMPMREMWDICINTTDARLISEFMALANRIEGLRKEVVFFIEEWRKTQMEVIASCASRLKGDMLIPPDSLALLATSLALSLTREKQIGIDLGHDTVQALVASILEVYEPVG